MSFLYVGHTHEDIDAAFSVIADNLRKKSAETITDLRTMLHNNKLVHGLYNFRVWIETSISNIKGHSRPLHYKFSKTPLGVKGFYKKVHDMPWIAMTQNILQSVPEGNPKILIPPRIDQIEVKNISKVISKAKDSLTPSKFEEMLEFLKKIKHLQENSAALKRYASGGATWLLRRLPKQQEGNANSTGDLPPNLRQALDREVEVPQVSYFDYKSIFNLLNSPFHESGNIGKN